MTTPNDPANDPNQPDPGTGTPPEGTPPKETGTPPATGDGKTFTQEEVNALVAKETSKAARGKVDPKELGFDSAKDMQEFITSMKSKADADKSEAEKAKEAEIKAARDEARNEVLATANERIIRAEFLVQAVEAGIPREAVNDAFLLAQAGDEWEVAVDEKGKVTGLDAEFFTALKEAKPFLFSTTPNGTPKPGDANPGGHGGGKEGNLSEEELRSRYPALRK